MADGFLEDKEASYKKKKEEWLKKKSHLNLTKKKIK